MLLVIELYHPADFTKDPGMFAYLRQAQPAPYLNGHDALGYFGPDWWFTLHSIQTPLVGLVSVGLWLAVARIDGARDGTLAAVFAWASRAATFVFLIYYTALDSIGGTGMARAIVTANAMVAAGTITAAQAAQLLDTVWTDPHVGGVGSTISLTGSWAVFFAAAFAAVALFLARRAPWPALVLLILFGWQLEISHTAMHGPVAFGLLTIAGVWLWFGQQRARRSAGAATPSMVDASG
ncbi:MAG: hypothetical protein QOD51_1662 [Candidatus Eremiobacteraeota bacterium]|nr:hypothetical protein [Candidatus Eremiobacteraeota bacterium]